MINFVIIPILNEITIKGDRIVLAQIKKKANFGIALLLIDMFLLISIE